MAINFGALEHRYFLLLAADNRYQDIALQFRIHETGELTEIFGGRWDQWTKSWGWHRSHGTDPPEDLQVVVRECSENQWDVIQPGPQRNIYVSCGRGWGKSFAAQYRLEMACVDTPGYSMLVAGATNDKLRIIWDRLVSTIPLQWLRPGRKGIRRAVREMHFLHGSQAVFRSADDPASLRSKDVHEAIGDEWSLVKAEADANALLTCRKGKSYRFTRFGTPQLNSDYYTMWSDAERERDDDLRAKKQPSVRLFNFKSTDNPFVSRTVFDDAAKRMSPDLYKQEVLGLWVALGGRVYPYIEKDTHLIRCNQPLEYLSRLYPLHEFPSYMPKDLTREIGSAQLSKAAEYVIGLDWGIRPMCGNVWKIFRQPPGYPDLFWCIDEVELLDKGHPDHYAAELKRRGYKPSNSVVVADASDTNASSNFRIMRKHGFRCLKPTKKNTNPEIKDRVNAVNALAMNARGQTALRIDPVKAPNTAKAFMNQAYDTAGKPERDEHNHRTAAGGYVITRLAPAAAMPSIQVR